MADERCPTCGGDAVIRPVPGAFRGLLTEDPEIVLFCARCLEVRRAPGDTVDREWRPTDTSGALPSDPEAALGVGILVSLLSSVALYREEIEITVETLETHHGVDPLLALDRIATAPLLEPTIDVPRRRQQLAQLVAD